MPMASFGLFTVGHQGERTCQVASSRVAFLTFFVRIITTAMVTVIGRPRRCTHGNGPSTCPFRGGDEAGQRRATSIVAAIFRPSLQAGSITAIKVSALVPKGPVRPKGASVGSSRTAQGRASQHGRTGPKGFGPPRRTCITGAQIDHSQNG